MSLPWLVAIVAAVGCSARAPAPLDVHRLMATRGPVEARRDLAIRILANPRDLQAHLALAELDEQVGRPSDAIDELAEVEKQGGPLGVRWHPADRARFARLLAARGRARLARGSAAALADLRRAQQLGATIGANELVAARGAAALAKLRHVDAAMRAEGRAELAAIASVPAVTDRAAFGVWLWAHDARREAFEQLSAWHAATAPPRDAATQAAYLRAVAWWTPGELPPPVASERIGPVRARDALGDPDAERALLAAPLGARTSDPADAAAFAAIALRGALRGDGAWLELLAVRVDLAKLDVRALPRGVRPAFARFVGKRESPPDLDGATDDVRLVAAAERLLAGASVDAVRAALGPAADRADGRALLAIAVPVVPVADGRPLAVARYVAARTGVTAEVAMVALARGYERDPGVAERLGRDFVAMAADAALAHAAVGAAFEALGDPRRARAEWQAAADASAEFATGLAEAIARTGDGDAALVAMATAAAWSGDPAPVLVVVGRALLDAHRAVDALTAARAAIDLAGPDTLAAALDLAIAASRLAKRDAQADGLGARRARLAPPVITTEPALDDPTDGVVALDALEHTPTAAATARAWVAARWNPRDVALRAALLRAMERDDPRRATVVAELVGLAGDPDPERALAAALALR